MSNHDHLSNIGLHPAYDPDPAVHVPVRVEALRKRIADAERAIDEMVGLQGQTVVVTIGRNVADGRGGQGPMPAPHWEEFRHTTSHYLTETLVPEFSSFYDGFGEWQEVEEMSTTYVCSGISTTRSADALRADLSDLARSFGQDAIALTIGATTLVES